MSVTADSVRRLRPPRNVLGRYAVAVGVAAIATAFRAALDPLLHDQVPYVAPVASAVAAAWLGGVGGGILNVAVCAFATNYFFVEPRHEFIPHGQDWLAMGLYSVVALGLVWFVARWRQAQHEVRRLHAEMSAVLDQMPVGVLIGDPGGRIRYMNAAIRSILGASIRTPSTADEMRATADYVPQHPDGRPMAVDETPLARARTGGETVVGEELHVVHGDGSRRITTSYAAPVRDEDNRVNSVVVAMLDVTEQRRMAGELRRREEQLSAATLAAEVGVWTWKPDTNVITVGANWRGLFGVAADADVTFDTWTGALHPDDREGAARALKTAWQNREQFVSEYRVVLPDGAVRWVIDRGRVTHDESGRVNGMAGVNVDITKRRAAEEGLRDANRLKDEFLATLSHELRTPLNAIVGWSDMLRRGNLPPDAAQRAVDSIYRNAKVQNELINDVLDVSRIISGKVRIETQPVNPVAVLQNAMESVRAAADAKGVALATDFADIPFPITADPTRLQQVFWNLLTNAVKFTPTGGLVRVSAGLVDGLVQVQVADTGMGIAPDFLPFVFDRFRQRDSSMTRTQGGLGLGLAIVRHLVELHGGTVKAQSAGEERGATFTVTLPARRFHERRSGGDAVLPRQAPVPAIEPLPDDVPSLCGLRVLVVDDESDAREVAATVLRHHGATVALAANAREAIEQFDSFEPQVLLVDLAMPDIDGYTFLATVRRSCGQAGATVPAIALTAYAREEDERRALASGFGRHLAKPVDPHTLVRAVSRVGPPSPSIGAASER